MSKWLKEEFDSKDDAENLFWVGGAWMARVNLLKDEPEYVADLFVGVSMLERSREIDHLERYAVASPVRRKSRPRRQIRAAQWHAGYSRGNTAAQFPGHFS